MKRVAIRPMCCNPLNLKNHPRVCSKDLRSVSKSVLDIYSVGSSAKICSKCRVKIPKTEEQHNGCNIDDEFEDQDFIDKKEVLKCLNQCLIHLNEPVFDLKKLSSSEYICSKLDNLKKILMEQVFVVKEMPIENPENKILESIKEDYIHSESKELKQKFLQVLPKDWSYKQIKSELPNASCYSIRSSRSPRLMKETTLKTQTRASLEKSVKKFYCDDEFSRILPGKNDYVSIKVMRNFNTLNIKFLKYFGF